MFSDFAIWYLFLAGTAGGAFLCATVMDVRANPGWDVRRVPLCARCGMLGAFGLLALAALMLFCDLGNPFDIWYLFESPLRSIVSMGAWLMTSVWRVRSRAKQTARYAGGRQPALQNHPPAGY